MSACIQFVHGWCVSSSPAAVADRNSSGPCAKPAVTVTGTDHRPAVVTSLADKGDGRFQERHFSDGKVYSHGWPCDFSPQFVRLLLLKFLSPAGSGRLTPGKGGDALCNICSDVVFHLGEVTLFSVFVLRLISWCKRSEICVW